MLRIWNSILIWLTFLASIFGTYLTRSGVVSSQHAFASGGVGDWFLGLVYATLAVPLFLVVYRWNHLRAEVRIGSLASREAVFVLNNVILVTLGFAIALVTLLPKLVLEWFGVAITISAEVYNFVTAPFFALLLLFTAIGPAMAWVHTGRRALVRYFLIPSMAAVPVAAALQWTAASLHGGEGVPIPIWKEVVVAGGFNYLGALIFSSLAFEVLRAARMRARHSATGFGRALFAILVKDNRRYGGYLVHVGLALLALGIVNSSVFQVHVKKLLSAGERFPLGGYDVTAVRADEDPEHAVYSLRTLELELARGGNVVATLEPEMRHYRKKNQTTREVRIHHGLLEDVYVFFDHADEPGHYDVTFYRNPLMILGWLGWVFMIAGGLWAALPMGRRQVGLAE